MSGVPREHVGIAPARRRTTHPAVGAGGGRHDLGALVHPHRLEEVAQRAGVVAPRAGQLPESRVRGGVPGLAAQQRLEGRHRRRRPPRQPPRPRPRGRSQRPTQSLLARVRLHGADGTGSIANQAERDGEQGTGREGARGEDPEGGLPRKLRPQRDGDTGGLGEAR